MPLDAICLRALTNELKGQLLGARIDKVQQPARDQIVLLLRGNLRLLLNAGPNQPRVQLTEVLRENPAEPPMLCMLLRKHLVGGRITEIEQSGLERIVTFTVRSVNELGESGTKKLVLEAMGRRSNLLLLDEDDRILDCMRRVEFEVSGARALLPGLYYQDPEPVEKRCPQGLTQAEALLSSGNLTSKQYDKLEDLRSRTQGRGLFTMQFDHYEEVPKSIAEKVTGARKGD